MIVLINGGPALNRYGPNPYVGRLVSPRSGNAVKPGERWAADNDSFGAWDEGRFLAMLRRFEDVPRCLFVAVPDVVADARATLHRFEDWKGEVAGRGLPVAFVGQDGAEDLDVPWDEMDAWFVGGTTEWKLSGTSADLVAEANRRDKWTHMGRVNTRRRMKIAYDFGCDSIDGSGWSKFPDEYMLNYLPYMVNLHRHTNLF